MNENPNYFAIIPAFVRYDKRLTPNAKLLYAEITALCNKSGFCYATNEYFANLYGVSKVSISTWIKNLVECGYISSEIVYREGTKEILNRYLKILYDPHKENFSTPPQENFMENNKIYNNKKNNNITSLKRCMSTENPLPSDKEIIDNLNSIFEKHHCAGVKLLSRERKTKLLQRMKDSNLSFAQFCETIDSALENSPFLKGVGAKGWQANLDFFLQKSSWAKVIEGFYSDRCAEVDKVKMENFERIAKQMEERYETL